MPTVTQAVKSFIDRLVRIKDSSSKIIDSIELKAIIDHLHATIKANKDLVSAQQQCTYVRTYVSALLPNLTKKVTASVAVDIDMALNLIGLYPWEQTFIDDLDKCRQQLSERRADDALDLATFLVNLKLNLESQPYSHFLERAASIKASIIDSLNTLSNIKDDSFVAEVGKMVMGMNLYVWELDVLTNINKAQEKAAKNQSPHMGHRFYGASEIISNTLTKLGLLKTEIYKKLQSLPIEAYESRRRAVGALCDRFDLENDIAPTAKIKVKKIVAQMKETVSNTFHALEWHPGVFPEPRAVTPTSWSNASSRAGTPMPFSMTFTPPTTPPTTPTQQKHFSFAEWANQLDTIERKEFKR